MSGRTSQVVLGLALALALATAGCGPTVGEKTGHAGKDPAKAAADPGSAVDAQAPHDTTGACAMLKPAEVEKLVGSKASSELDDSDVQGPSCTWRGKDYVRTLAFQFSWLKYDGNMVGNERGYGWVPQNFDVMASPGAKPVSGLGDKAYARYLPGADGMVGPRLRLYVLHHGNRAFSLSLGSPAGKKPTADELLAELRPLAEAVAARH